MNNMNKIKKVFRLIASFPQMIFSIGNKKKIYTTEKWIIQSLNMYKFLNKIYPKYQLRHYLYHFSINVKELIGECPSLQDDLKKSWMNIFDNSDDEVKMFITKLIFVSDIIDDNVCKKIMDFAENTANESYRYWTTMDISNVTFLTQRGLYTNFYTDRRNLMGKIALESKVSDYKINRDDGKNILGVIVYHLYPTMQNSLFRVLSMVLNGLNSYYDEIHVFSLDTFYNSEHDDNITTIARYGDIYSKNYSKKIADELGKNIIIHYVISDNYKKRNEIFISQLFEVNPSTIIDLSDEFSPLSYVYSKYFPTFYIPLRVGISSSFYNYLIGQKWKIEKMNNIFHCTNMNSVIEWSFPEYVPKMTGEYTRNEIGIQPNSFVIVTVAYCSKVVDQDFMDNFARLLTENENFVWIIISDKAPEYMHQKYEYLFSNNRIIEREYEKNLFAFYKICDVILRTDVTGGSGATAIAAMAGLPIVMTNYVCDPMRWLGFDYSNISSSKEICEEIFNLYSDKDYYNIKKERCKLLVSDAINADKKWRKLANILIEKSLNYE